MRIFDHVKHRNAIYLRFKIRFFTPANILGFELKR